MLLNDESGLMLLSSNKGGQIGSNAAPDISNEPSEKHTCMSRSTVIDLMLCGSLLAGLTLVSQHLQSALPRLTFFTGLVGGIICIFRAILGRHLRLASLGSIIALLAVAGVFFLQAFQSCRLTIDAGLGSRLVALIMIMQVVFSLATLVPLIR